MKDFIEQLIMKLEKYKTCAYVTGITNNPYEFGACDAMNSAIRIVKETAEEYKKEWSKDYGWKLTKRLLKKSISNAYMKFPKSMIIRVKTLLLI